jgi:hypothetical protein
LPFDEIIDFFNGVSFAVQYSGDGDVVIPNRDIPCVLDLNFDPMQIVEKARNEIGLREEYELWVQQSPPEELYVGKGCSYYDSRE